MTSTRDPQVGWSGPGALAGFDGTTGRSDHGGRRTHIIQLLRDAPAPVSVAEIAERIGVPMSTARLHLEALTDAGLATRTHDAAGTPGRPRVLYIGVLPDQTHERAQGYRLLSEGLVDMLVEALTDPSAQLHQVGLTWGETLTRGSARPGTEDELVERTVAKLDALWFAPELEQESEPVRIVLHHCPLIHTQRFHPEAADALIRGLIDGALTGLGWMLGGTPISIDPTDQRRAVELATS